MVFKLELGTVGAALSIGISYWLNVILLGFYMRYSATCKETQILFTADAFLSIKEFFHFATPSTIMVW